MRIPSSIILSCITIGFFFIGGKGMSQDKADASRKQLLSELLRLNDDLVQRESGRQLMQKGSRYDGALFDTDSVVSPIRTAQFIQALMCSYISAGSRFYNAADIRHRMERAASALVNMQHEDGTIDLLTTNFHSTPDLGFTVLPLAQAYSLMLKNRKRDYGTFSSSLKQYLLKAGEALKVGGIHTPNHRWVVSAALAWLYELFPDKGYRQRIDQWLAEKVDIDQDGQYQERSTSVYTPVTNRCLLDIADKLKYDHLYDAVRRNLNMTLYLVHANGEIVTETSRRQDKYLRSNMAKYFHAYNYMALLDKDSRYAGMVSFIQETVPASDLHYMLPILLDDPALLATLPSPEPVPVHYHKHFTHSDMVRIREGSVDMSIITDNATVFTFFKGDAALEALRISSAFFGKGQFLSQKMEMQGETYLLTATTQGPYYQPLPKEKIPAHTDAWAVVPRTEREQSEVQTLTYKVFITPAKGRANFRVEVEGPENLPVALEFGFRSGGSLSGVDPKPRTSETFLAKNGEWVIYRNGNDTVRVGPGALAHKWTQLRGALPKLQADCVYFTGYAPCQFEFTIE
jgi:hypothetical protein